MNFSLKSTTIYIKNMILRGYFVDSPWKTTVHRGFEISDNYTETATSNRRVTALTKINYRGFVKICYKFTIADYICRKFHLSRVLT